MFPNSHPFSRFIQALDRLERDTVLVEEFHAAAGELLKQKKTSIDEKIAELRNVASESIDEVGTEVLFHQIMRSLKEKEQARLDRRWKFGKKHWRFLWGNDALKRKALEEYIEAEKLLAERAQNLQVEANKAIEEKISVLNDFLDKCRISEYAWLDDEAGKLVEKAEDIIFGESSEIVKANKEELLIEFGNDLDNLVVQARLHLDQLVNARIQEITAGFVNPC